MDVIDSENIIAPRLSQLKSYLKILNIPITSDVVKRIIKTIYTLNNVTLTSKPKFIKALPKSNIAVIWIDIWNA